MGTELRQMAFYSWIVFLMLDSLILFGAFISLRLDYVTLSGFFIFCTLWLISLLACGLAYNFCINSIKRDHEKPEPKRSQSDLLKSINNNLTEIKHMLEEQT